MKNGKLLGLALCAGLASSVFAQCPGAPTTEFDFGVLSAGTATTNVTMTTNEVHWLKFSLAAPVDMNTLTFLNIESGTSTVDTEFAVYDCAGNLVATDDDDGNSLSSALTFGSGNAALLGTTTPTISNGRDGRLAAGDYYLAVVRFNATFGLTGFGSITSTATTGGVAPVNITLGAATALADPVGTTDLGTLTLGNFVQVSGAALSASQVKWFKVTVPAANLALNQFVDIDTEGSVLAATNATRIAVYNVTGAITGTLEPTTTRNNFTTALQDATDGTDSLSQISLGVGTRVAPGNGLAYNGRDGNLQAGTYLIGVAGPGTAPSGTGTTGLNFGFTSTSTNTGTINLRVATGLGAVPLQGTGSSTPTSVNNCGTSSSLFRVTVTPATTPPGTSTGITVTANLTGVGGSATQTFYDDATHGDVTAGDNIFSYSHTVPNTVAAAAYTLPFNVADAQARTATGNLALTVTACPPPPPANDPCSGAIALSIGTTPATNVSATYDGPTGSCRAVQTPDVWYTFTPVQTGTYTIDTCQSATPNFYDSVLTVLSGTCGAFTELACSDDFGGTCGTNGFASKVTLGLNAGQTYYVRIASYSTTTTLGTFLINIDQPVISLAIAGNASTGAELSTVLLTSTVTPATFPNSTGIAVTGDLSTIGGSSTQTFYDNGTNGDVTAGDNIFSYAYTLPVSVVAAAYPLPVAVSDAELRTATGTLNLTVTNGANGACCTTGTCSVTRQTLCVAGGGTWQGNGTNCGGNGYTFTPSANAFMDISATGTVLATISNADDATQNVSLPFAFNHLGNSYTSVNVSSNGNLQFGASNSTAFGNALIPTAAVPNDMLAPAWDDYDLDEAGGGQGTVYTMDDTANGRFIISWQGVSQFLASPLDSHNFQVMLYNTGDVEFRYGAMVNTVLNTANDVTVGYENIDGTFGGSLDPATAIGAGNVSYTLSPNIIPSPCGPTCDSIDFNGDTLFPDTGDIDDFLSVFSGGPCSNDPNCGDIDFNNDGLFPDTLDIDALLSVFSGGPCLV